MPDSPVLPVSDALIVSRGRSYEVIKSAIPSYLINASLEHRAALRQVKPRVPSWYGAATPEQKNTLKALLENRAATQKRFHRTMSLIQPLEDFARPLLERALEAVGFTLPVNDVFLHVYTPAFDAFGLRTGGYSSRKLSLLQAALHNFEQPETEAGYFGEGSGFITRPDSLGRFKPYLTALTVEAFTELCRELDIGEKYQEHLQLYLSPQHLVPQGRLEGGFKNNQKAMLKLDAHVALLKGDIDTRIHGLLMRVLNDEREIKIGEHQVWYRYPCVLGLVLQGCVVFDLCVKERYSDAMTVWIPGDPDHPLKQYASFFDFRDHMLRKLTAGAAPVRETGLTPYQQFLSQFIAQKDRPYYYRRLTELVTDAPEQPWGAEWFRSEKTQLWVHALAPIPSMGLNVPPNPDVHQSRVQAEHPTIKISICTMSGEYLWVDVDLWATQLQDMRARAFADARNMALPTADADASNRSARLSHYLNIGLFAVNLVAMAVPPLGDAMMVLMAGQLLYETIEGIQEWSDGDTEAAWGHIGDVLENMATLAAGAVVFKGVVAPVVEKLKVITLPGGKPRLWNGDLAPYAHSLSLEPGSLADASGLHRLNERQVLPHGGKHYVVEKDPLSGHYRVQHPTLADAYQPEFKHNGQGVWVHEGEDPITWTRSQLLRRLGPSVEGLNDTELESILKVSDVHEDVLRRMYVENEPTPVLLVESICKFKAYSLAESAVTQVKAGPMSAQLCSYAAAFTVELPGWPTGKAIAVSDPLRPGVASVRYGSTQASGADLITVSRSQLMNGELAAHVIDALDQQQLEAMLGERLPFAREERLGLFKEQLSKRMQAHTQRLFDSLYEDPLMASDPERGSIELMQRVFPKLSTSTTRRLLGEANAAERESLRLGKIPARIMTTARHLQHEARLSSAYLGLYREKLVTPDTETLVLNTLENVPGWANDLRLEVRNDGFGGELRASFGEQGATHRKVLARISDGQYLALDEEGNQLHGADDLYRSLQHALPDAHRRSMGLPHSGQGAELKLKIEQYALPRARLRALLKMRGKTKPFYQAPERLPDGGVGYPLSGRGAPAAFTAQEAFRARFKELYPHSTSQDLARFFEHHRANAFSRLIELEQEFQALGRTLNRWTRSPIDGTPLVEHPTDAQRPTLVARIYISSRLRQAWRRAGPPHLDATDRYIGQTLLFDGTRMGPVLETLPALEANFDHVSKIDLSQAHATDAINGFLSNFPKLRSLDLSSNNLTRLPPSVGNMPRLQLLDLGGNQITLTPESVAQLKGLTKMRLMLFDESPLGLAPNISRMPNLEGVFLTRCNLTAWPDGLFAQSRPSNFKLYLEGNPLTEIPDVAPGSHRAEILARTVLTQGVVSEEVYQKFLFYRESVGIDIDRLRPPGLERDSRFWIGGVTSDEVSAQRALWNRVEHAHGSEPFFDILRDQAENMKNRSPEFRRDMTTKVWQMLQAMDENPVLRDKILQMASAPFTCVDAGAQIFNALGIEVLFDAIYENALEEGAPFKMLELGRGKSRLDELGRIARARVAELEASGRRHPEYDGAGRRVQHYDANDFPIIDIDEVEIYLRYTTQLSSRLKLPWQAPSMMFNEPDVTAEMIESAFTRINALEQGEGLRNQLLDQPMWLDFMERAYKTDFDRVSAKVEALTDLQTAQQEWVLASDLPLGQKAGIRTRIELAAATLKIPASEIAPGRVMSDEEHDLLLVKLGEDRGVIMRILTDRIIVEDSLRVPVAS